MSLRRFHKFWLFEFYNLVIGIGYLTHVDGWGISINWDRRDSANLFKGELLWRKYLTVWVDHAVIENGFLSWIPNHWISWDAAGVLDRGTVLASSEDWTGRACFLHHIKRPRIHYWSIK